MKFLLVLCWLIPSLIVCIEVPYSQVLVKTDSNHLRGMERISPPDHELIELETDCWFWHDGKNLYAYWELEIDEHFSPGVFATRDDTQTSDYVRIQIKTVSHEDFAYYFAAYPRGTCFDAVRKENFQVDKAWNSRYNCISTYSDKVWQVTMMIPFKDLRFEGDAPYHWSVSLARQVQATGSAYGNPYSSTSGCTIRQYFDSFEPMIINETIESSQSYTVIPYFYRSYNSLTKTQTFDPEHIGLNVAYRPSINASLKLALNPDFTEVPIDEERDSHNDKYPPQLNENRLFFTEDMNAFGVGSNIFYSRNIMQPKFAGKYTASGKNWSFGILSAIDKETTMNGEVINRDDFYNAIAYKRQLKSFSSHFTILSRTNDNTGNYVFHSFPFWQVSPTLKVYSRMLYSLNKREKEEFDKGYKVTAGIDKRMGKLSANLNLTDISKLFFPAMGDAGIRENVNLYAIEYSFYYENFVKDSFIRTYSFNHDASGVFEKEGEHEIRNGNIGFGGYFNFINQTSCSFGLRAGKERLDDDLLKWYSLDASYNWSGFLPMNGYFGSNYGKFIHYILADIYPRQTFYCGINGYLGTMISYNLRNNHVIWKGFPRESQLDEEYDITNFDMDITFSNALKFVCGIRYSNYEKSQQKQHIGYFSTMHWYVNSTTTLYAGYKATEDENGEDFVKTSGSCWFKIMKVF